MADNPNKYLFSMVAIVAITGLFLIFMGKSETSGTETVLTDDATGMAVGYDTETGQFPQYDEQGNKICSGTVQGDSIVWDYIPGCGGVKSPIKDWALGMPPSVKAYYNNKHVAARLTNSAPGTGRKETADPGVLSIKGGVGETVTGGTDLPTKAPMQEAEIIEVLEAGQMRTSTGTIV